MNVLPAATGGSLRLIAPPLSMFGVFASAPTHASSPMPVSNEQPSRPTGEVSDSRFLGHTRTVSRTSRCNIVEDFRVEKRDPDKALQSGWLEEAGTAMCVGRRKTSAPMRTMTTEAKEW